MKFKIKIDGIKMLEINIFRNVFLKRILEQIFSESLKKADLANTKYRGKPYFLQGPLN